MKSIVVRTLSGSLYVGLIIASLYFNSNYFAGVCLLFNALALIEFQNFRNSISENRIVLPVVGNLVFVLFHLTFLNIISEKWLFLLLLIPLIMLSFALFTKKNKAIESCSSFLLGLIYITLPLLLANKLNLDGGNDFSWFVFSVFLLIWANDTFAFLTGKFFGKHKLFERITPKKTWEGFVGGLFAVLIIGWLMYPLVNFSGLLKWLILVTLISIGSVFGDFVESMFKRTKGLKDSGKLMPGHGGILDRIDSLLFVFPIVYIYTQIIS